MTSVKKAPKSKLALAIESRERPSHEFEVQGFFGLGSKEIHKVSIRINTKSEEDASVVAAHRYAHSFKGEGSESARKDADILTDGKAIEALFRACRSVSDNGSAKLPGYPAFPGPTWMRDNLTTDQIATLLNLYHEVRRVQAPVPWQITIEQVMVVARACSATSHTDIPDEALAKQSKEWVSQAFILLSQKFFHLIEEFDLSDKIDSWFYPEDLDNEEEIADAVASEGERQKDTAGDSEGGGEG